MNVDKEEIRKLKKLLTQRLSYSERTQIDRRLRQLRGEASEPTPSHTASPYLLGTWDRPPRQPEPPSAPASKAEVPTEENTVPRQDSKPNAVPLVRELSPEQAETIAETVAALAERIGELRSFWARTLSVEVEQQAESCLARLQELTREIPRDLAEVALGSKKSLLDQPVREVKKPEVSQNVQLNLLPPSAPSLDVTGAWTDLYYALNQPRQPHAPQHPPGYVPDGLQSFV